MLNSRITNPLELGAKKHLRQILRRLLFIKSLYIMVKRIYLLLVVLLIVGCSKKLFDLTMSKTPYTGDELRIDGYYLSNSTSENNLCVAVFYRDGFCIHTRVIPESEDIFDYIENEYLLNDAYIAKIMGMPGHIGVFQILYPNIKFECWEFRTTTFSHYGEILDDSTFIINEEVDNLTGKSYSKSLTYRFVKFSPKPDRTNNFIK
ncbi:MAG: hypothetical protein HN704_10265 [Bacteroidetes bacterium]|nr:hypothetical protein [Bacteroidota bacterium]MBT6687541.1 hypothetical protein [Bacteroidota bacterium]MBT7142772.1 hypothetical protein [Bacteroidota bacterium]MBT7491975.1 hypothetical protein [Bacteroidota bacterium]